METYLIVHGGENEYWTCFADSPASAIAQFEEAQMPVEDINEVYICTIVPPHKWGA